jgi:hypothetical protein
MSEPFWIADPSVLFRSDTWLSFVPTPNMTVDQSLNAVVRFVTYLSGLLFLCSMDFRYILYIPVTMMITIALHKWFPVAKEMFQGSPSISGYVGKATTKPTDDNPFMNPSLTDINENPNKPPPAEITSREIREKVNASFAQTSNLYMDTSDVYANMRSAINFHNVPTDDLDGYKKFLGGGTTSDKILNEGYVPAKGTLATPSAGDLFMAVNPGQKKMSMSAWNAATPDA